MSPFFLVNARARIPAVAALVAALVAAVILAFALPALATPAAAKGLYGFEPAQKRGAYVRGRSVFIDPVGKIDKGATRRLPSLTVKPAEFNFGVKTTTLNGTESAAARALRSYRSPTLDLPPKSGL